MNISHVYCVPYFLKIEHLPDCLKVFYLQLFLMPYFPVSLLASFQSIQSNILQVNNKCQFLLTYYGTFKTATKFFKDHD